MRITFVMWRHSTFPEDFPEGPLGGAEAATWHIANQLSQRHTIEIHCIGREDKSENIGGITLRRIGTPIQSKWIQGDIYFQKSLRQAQDTDIIQAITCVEPALYHPRVNLHLENELHPYLPYPYLKRKIYLRRLRNIAGVSAVSRYVAKNFAAHLPYDKPITTILNGADTQEYTPQKRDRGYIQQELGIDEDQTVITYAGAIHRRKGLHILLEAYQDLPHTYDVHLLVLGGVFYSKKRPGDLAYLETQKRRMERIEKKANVAFPGPIPRPELPRLLASSDIFVCPSLWHDPCPLVCAEAHASGLPVIGTRKGGIPDVVENQKTGLICEPTPEQLQQSIRTLLENPSKTRILGRRARRRAETSLDWGIIAQRLEETYTARDN